MIKLNFQGAISSSLRQQSTICFDYDNDCLSGLLLRGITPWMLQRYDDERAPYCKPTR